MSPTDDATIGGTEAISALGPIDPSSVIDPHEDGEKEKAAPWIMRKLVGSMTGRIVMASYESLRAAGTGIICLSPWGDSSPLTLPCIRFRDVVVHTVIAATGGVAAIASPVMGPVSDVVVGSFGDTILVHLTLYAGFDLSTKIANDLLIERPITHAIPINSSRLETTKVKVLLITLKFKATIEDANLGFFRSSVHKDPDLFAVVKDYLAVEKGWFNPYLFASARRPIIPRSMKADVVFCHGPFLQGDYRIGETLMKESASIIMFCAAPPGATPVPTTVDPPDVAGQKSSEGSEQQSEQPTRFSLDNIKASLNIPSLTNRFARSRSPSPSRKEDGIEENKTKEPEPKLTPLPPPAVPRRLVVIVVGIKPHRKLWTTSARPQESVIQYILLNGCPAIVLPVKVGAPLVAWDTLTLEQLWAVDLPKEGEEPGGKFGGIVQVLYEYLDLCIDWERVIRLGDSEEVTETTKRAEVKAAVTLLVASAIRSRDSSEAKKELERDRAGIAMWRIP